METSSKRGSLILCPYKRAIEDLLRLGAVAIIQSHPTFDGKITKYNVVPGWEMYLIVGSNNDADPIAGILYDHVNNGWHISRKGSTKHLWKAELKNLMLYKRERVLFGDQE